MSDEPLELGEPDSLSALPVFVPRELVPIVEAVVAEVASLAGEDGEGMTDADWDSELFDICQVALKATAERYEGRNNYDYTIQLAAQALYRAMRLAKAAEPLTDEELDRLMMLTFLDARWALHTRNCDIQNDKDAACTCGVDAEWKELSRRYEATRGMR